MEELLFIADTLGVVFQQAFIFSDGKKIEISKE